MFFKEEIGDMIALFKEDPETGEMTDTVEEFLIALGEVMTPAGPVIMCRDKSGFEWKVLRSRIGENNDSEFGWVKQNIGRIMSGYEYGGRYAKQSIER